MQDDGRFTLADAYATSDTDKVRDLYSRWAATYDDDLVDGMGWRAPDAAASVLWALLPEPDAWVLDVGCGTGLTGAALRRQGYRNVVGVDITEAMLERARAKDVYTGLCVADIMAPLADGAFDGITGGRRFDAVFSAGVFSHGPVMPAHLANLLPVLAPGGLSAHTVNAGAYEALDYAGVLAGMAREGTVEVVHDGAVAYTEKEGTGGRLVVLRRTLG